MCDEVGEGAGVLFEPDNAVLKELGLSSSESLLTAGPGGKLLIPLQNHRHCTVDIGEQLSVGKVRVVDMDQVKPLTSLCADECEVSDDGGCEGDVMEESEVNAVRIGGGDRTGSLRKVLNIPGEDLEPAQVKELEEFLSSFDDVFSLDEDDLGHTSLVRHQVDTGDSPPIKQAPRRIPFSRRQVVADLIDDMMEKGVVQPSTMGKSHSLGAEVRQHIPLLCGLQKSKCCNEERCVSAPQNRRHLGYPGEEPLLYDT